MRNDTEIATTKRYLELGMDDVDFKLFSYLEMHLIVSDCAI